MSNYTVSLLQDFEIQLRTSEIDLDNVICHFGTSTKNYNLGSVDMSSGLASISPNTDFSDINILYRVPRNLSKHKAIYYKVEGVCDKHGTKEIGKGKITIKQDVK